MELLILGAQLCLKMLYLKLEILDLFVHYAVLILGFAPLIRGVSGCVVYLGLFPNFPHCLGFALAFSYAQLLGRSPFCGV